MSEDLSDDAALAFIERILTLLETTRYSTTYKLATLLAIIDVAAETGVTAPDGTMTVSGRDIGRRVLELYWPHSEPFTASRDAMPVVLRQSPHNDIPAKLAHYRVAHQLPAGVSVAAAQRVHPDDWAKLERKIVHIVIRMPIPKLQRFSTGTTIKEDRFIYEFGWVDEVAATEIDTQGFDDRVILCPNVGEWLVRLAGLLRPAIQTKWLALIARRNTAVLDQHQLDEFFFGAQRVSLRPVTNALMDVQDGRCFYCDSKIVAKIAIDHFLPWARHPLNFLDNLAATHAGCNTRKSASLAALDHVERWIERFDDCSNAYAEMRAVADATNWPRNPTRTLAAGRAMYMWLPPSSLLWLRDDKFESLDAHRRDTVFGGL